MPVSEIVVSTNYVTLVVNTPDKVHTTVDVVAGPMSAVSNVAADNTLAIGTPGPQGPPGPPGTSSGGGGELEFDQASASATWVILHNLNAFPSVVVIDSGGSVIIGDVEYDTSNQITISFTNALAGKAYLNV